MANIATLKPPIEKGEHRGNRGRQPGQVNRVTRLLKLAIIDGAETSKHCPEDDKTLRAYCKFLADEHPGVFANLLGRLVPVQAKITTAPVPQRLSEGMDMETMVKTLEWKLKSGYRPPVIEHNDDDDDEVE